LIRTCSTAADDLGGAVAISDVVFYGTNGDGATVKV
jgi:hypothetical protein